jgi:hypothetical protein
MFEPRLTRVGQLSVSEKMLEELGYFNVAERKVLDKNLVFGLAWDMKSIVMFRAGTSINEAMRYCFRARIRSIQFRSPNVLPDGKVKIRYQHRCSASWLFRLQESGVLVGHLYRMTRCIKGGETFAYRCSPGASLTKKGPELDPDNLAHHIPLECLIETALDAKARMEGFEIMTEPMSIVDFRYAKANNLIWGFKTRLTLRWNTDQPSNKSQQNNRPTVSSRIGHTGQEQTSSG